MGCFWILKGLHSACSLWSTWDSSPECWFSCWCVYFLPYNSYKDGIKMVKFISLLVVQFDYLLKLWFPYRKYILSNFWYGCYLSLLGFILDNIVFCILSFKYYLSSLFIDFQLCSFPDATKLSLLGWCFYIFLTTSD